MSKINLITTADDFGACNFIDDGIIEGVEKGVISCVSAFINFEARTESEPGGSYVGSKQAIKDFRVKFPNIPIGLHLTINAGTSVCHPNEVTKLLKTNSNSGKRYFRDIKYFDPTYYLKDDTIKQIGKEIIAQIDHFVDEFGPPNHITCHFGILFHFNNLLEYLIEENVFLRIPVRNPVLIFQTPIIKNEPDASRLRTAKRFFKKKSKMRLEGYEKINLWGNSPEDLIKLVMHGTKKKKRLRLLQNNNNRFPDYTLDYLYKRGDDYNSLSEMIAQLPRYIPLMYQGHRKASTNQVYELICHLGKGDLPESSPIGINEKYFIERVKELERLVADKHILESTAINLVNFTFL